MSHPYSADEAFLRAMPKAELHCHFEGSVPADTMIALARSNGVVLPTYDPAELYRVSMDKAEFLEQMRDTPRWVLQGFARKYQQQVATLEDFYGLATFERFLERFDDVCAVLTTADEFSRAAYDSLVAAADSSNVRYREMFFHPMSHPGVPYRTMLDGLVDGIRAAEADRGIIGRLLPSLNRDCSSAAAVELCEEIIAHRVPEVVGLASDYDEEHLPAFYEAYRFAAKAGLPGTAHAGEYGAASSVAEAIDVLGCSRIDHGYAIVADADVTRRARDAGVHFASIFSWSIGVTAPESWPLPAPALSSPAPVASPIADMLAAGLSVSLSSDDPAFDGFGSMADEYVWAAGSLGFDRTRMTALALAALDGAWLDNSDRAALRRDFATRIAQLEA
ncbi:adenosine deaminase family protein [Streptomyces aureus]|uniref:Adenosine deaminase n=1 Tax=Streptomyces aureus TaxID=193461 RepID=A0ABV4SPT9_9ACTN